MKKFLIEAFNFIGTSNINDNVKVNLIPKRNLLCKENGIIKKWKKRRKTDSFINDVSNSECIKELGKEVFEQYQGSIEMKNLKSLRSIIFILL